MNYKIIYYLFIALFVLFVYAMFSLMMSFGILLRLMDRKHWHTASFLGTIYWLLTKEARAVANDYYQFNPNKGVAK